MMQMVINVSVDDLLRLQNIKKIIGGPEVMLTNRILKAIQDGVIIPEEHGRLIDADKLEQSMYHDAFEIESDMQKWESGCWIRYKMFESNIDNAPTIIEGGQTDE